MSIGIPIVDGILDIIKNGQQQGLEEAKVKANLEQAILAHDSQTVASVNATMQAEAKSEHWAVWLWRPMIGFTFAAVILNNYIVMPYFQNYVKPIAVPDPVWNAMLVILGAAAATRGWQLANQARNGNGNSNGQPTPSRSSKITDTIDREGRRD